MKRIVVIVYLFSSFFTSCNSLMGVKNLGSGYFFDTDQILYTEKSTYNGIGIVIIPNTVLETNEDNNYILVRAENNKKEMQYWIIDKNSNKDQKRLHEADSLFNSYYIYDNVFGPLSLAEFKDKKRSLKIDLDLK